jgi:hypothetical protein
MEARYVIRPDAAGFSILDLWTGQPATVAGTRQVGLSQRDAEHTADLLNRTAADRQGAQATA